MGRARIDRVCFATALAASLGMTAGARAQVTADEVPVIEPGREAEVVALFSPFELGGEVQDGYRLMNIHVEPTHIECELVGPGAEEARLRLEHPAEGERPEQRTRSFALSFQAGDERGRAALERLARAVRDNDHGGFFRMRARPAPEPAQRWFRRAGGGWAWLVDGSLWCLLGLGLMLALGIRALRREEVRARAAVLGITLVGALLRLTLSPHTFLGVWPYSRTTTLVSLVWDGPGLGVVARLFGPLDFAQVVTTMTLLFAILTPLAVWAHARELLDDRWAAVAAAGILAVLPEHLRFSHSEVAFIPSVALSSATFYLTHVALKDSSTRVRALALVFLPVAAGATFIARPLNVIFLPLLLFTALYLSRETASRRRRLLVSALLVMVGAATILRHLLVYYSDQVAAGLSARVLLSGLSALVSIDHDTLINPWITPPVLLAAAAGGVAWRLERGHRARTLFLVAWLLLFFVAHAYVLPRAVANQARYHLHLVVPFAMMAGIGMAALWRRRRGWAVALVVVTALSPLLHYDFIRDVDYNDMHEHRFVFEMRERIPEGCTVLEFTGEGEGDQDARFARLGTVRTAQGELRRFIDLPMGATRGWRDALRPEARAVLERPPPCLVYYEGLLCFAKKRRSEAIAPACAAVRDIARLEEMGRVDFASRIYDGRLATGLGDGRTPLTLRLYRVRGRATGGSSATSRRRR